MFRLSLAAMPLMFLAIIPATAEESEPLDAVQPFFEAMSGNNAELAASVMIEDGLLYGYVETADGLRLVRTSAEQFIAGMGERTDSLLERIWDVEVLQIDRLASGLNKTTAPAAPERLQNPNH